METRIFNKLDKELLKDWEHLWEKSPKKILFNSPGWTRSYIDAYKPKQVQIVAFYDGRKLCGVLPLVGGKCFGLSCYTIPGIGLAHQSAFFTDFSHQAMQLLMKELPRFKLINFGGFHQIDKEKLVSYCQDKCVITKSVVPGMSLKSSNEETFSVKRRSQIIKRARDVEKQLELVRVTNHRVGLKKVFEIDMASSKEKGGYNVFLNSEYKKFFESLVLYLGDRIRVNLLNYKKKPVAYEVGFGGDGFYVDIERAYLSEHDSFTPGKVLMVYLAEYLSREGYGEFNLGPGVDNFKKSIATDYHEVYNIVVSSNRFARGYVSAMLSIRENVYNFMFNHRPLYAIYKKVQRLWE